MPVFYNDPIYGHDTVEFILWDPLLPLLVWICAWTLKVPV